MTMSVEVALRTFDPELCGSIDWPRFEAILRIGETPLTNEEIDRLKVSPARLNALMLSLRCRSQYYSRTPKYK